jgi:hypothetical protein
MIDAKDLYAKVASKFDFNNIFYEVDKNGKNKFDSDCFQKRANSTQKIHFNNELKNLVQKRFEQADQIMREFISNLNVSFGNVVIGCGNHDVLRLIPVAKPIITCTEGDNNYNEYRISNTEDIFDPFENFINNLGAANSKSRCGEKGIIQCTLNGINVLLLNTNWPKPSDCKEGYCCVNCESIIQKLQDWRNSGGNTKNAINIIVAHKPMYEICEKARLAYKRYIKTPFMAEIREFIGENGIYLCGDKHTRSIVGSFFHDVPHYIGGEPLTEKDTSSDNYEVEYNLLQIDDGGIGIERKLHLCSSDGKVWTCELRPQDNVVAELYNHSHEHIVQNTFELLGMTKPADAWENLCQEVYGWNTKDRTVWNRNVDAFYKSICKFRICGVDDIAWKDGENIIEYICERIKDRITDVRTQNLLNIRGEYSSGKSTFLGLTYIYLLYQYSIGRIDFIPAYFNLENPKMIDKIAGRESYYSAVYNTFDEFTIKIQTIAKKQHQSVCYIIDGLDEQDCWSYGIEDSVGRGVLDILAKYEYVWFIMSFSQHRLPCFKNTLPTRKFNENSDILYFNPINVTQSGAEDNRFTAFVRAFIELKGINLGSNNVDLDTKVDAECNIIRKFRRLTINPGFMYNNYDFLTTTSNVNQNLLYEEASVDTVYKYYIDRQQEICLEKLGYGFVKYAPTMAYLFSYRGYTYEKFIRIGQNQDYPATGTHTLKSIVDNQNKIYDAFLFIKKEKDAREYLIALHYNHELQYYADHPQDSIEDDSILNEFIARDIAVLIRKLWTDMNKFVIVCEKLLVRDDLNNCIQSMLLYCLAHMQMYSPIRDRLQNMMYRKAEETLLKQNPKSSRLTEIQWKIEGNDNAEKLKSFINLGLLHTITVFILGNRGGTDLTDTIVANNDFLRYNRQYQMLYYGDLFIRGENRQRPLDPGNDFVGKGFDFHNCFNYLYVKLMSEELYTLRRFDLYTLWSLLQSRLEESQLNGHTKLIAPSETFFFRKSFTKQAVRVLQQSNEVFTFNLNNFRRQLKNKDIKFFEERIEKNNNIINLKLPYTKNSYNLAETSRHAEDSRRYRARKKAITELHDGIIGNMDVDTALWQTVIAYQNYPFYTSSGLPFSYTVKCKKNGDYSEGLLVSQKEGSKTLTRRSVILAFHNVLEGMSIVDTGYGTTKALAPAEYKRPKAIGRIFGISYVYSMFWKWGLISVPKKVEKKLCGK